MFHLYTGSGVVLLCEICEKIPFLKIAGIMLKFLGYYWTEITMISQDVLVFRVQFYIKFDFIGYLSFSSIFKWNLNFEQKVIPGKGITSPQRRINKQRANI